MTRVIDYSAPGDHRTVVQAALDAIREPLLVGLPSESGYLLATSSVNAEGVSRLIHLAQSVKRPLSLCLAEAGQIEDYLDRVPPQAMRLAQRSWPGPVILEFESTSQWVGPPLAAPLTEFLKNQPRRFASFGHPIHIGLSRILREPLVAVEMPAPSGGTWAAADGLELAQKWGEWIGLIVNAGFVSCPQGATAVHFPESGEWSISQHGVYSETQIAQLMAKLVVFVCTGNTCRSPMAEGLFRSLLCQRLECEGEDLIRRGYMVSSAGVAAFPGAPASPETLDILREEGIDLTDHTSQPVTEQLVAWADMILAMTSRHHSAVTGAFPQSASKVEKICVDGYDIPDPIGRDYSVYAECRDQIRQCLEHWLNRVLSED
jgi:protein-tyrosine-phosphatase/tRNA A37 threonylcarbamoyladenosine synthetase subunit TsaC/SUA5/YrdC